MNKLNKKTAIAAVSTLFSAAALLPLQAHASSVVPTAQVQPAAPTHFNLTIDHAVQQLISKNVLKGYEDGTVRADKHVTNAELIKMIVLSLGLEQNIEASQNDNKKNEWYVSYIDAAVANALIDNNVKLQPNKPAATEDAAAWIAKALKRDVKSIQYWMEGFHISGKTMTRGEAAQLLALSEKAIRSESAKIVSISALNNITLQVTFDAPLTLEDETTATANENFVFDNGLKLVNQPRLKTGAVATYIIPVQTMAPDTDLTITYKGQPHTVKSSSEVLRLSQVRQVTSDTFETASFRENGVIDYGYIISAYSGGRGQNAAVLDDNNRYNGQTMQIIPSLATRQATLTPEGGEPITVNYVGYTQSTDGKQEPKFRLPAGTTLQPGITYTVSSDWFELESNTFTAQAIEPLVIKSVTKAGDAVLHVELSEDPGDELFAYRSIQLRGSDGTTLTAQYKVQTRKGAIGVFELQSNGLLAEGVQYEILPVGNWATANQVKLNSN